MQQDHPWLEQMHWHRVVLDEAHEGLADPLLHRKSICNMIDVCM